MSFVNARDLLQIRSAAESKTTMGMKSLKEMSFASLQMIHKALLRGDRDVGQVRFKPSVTKPMVGWQVRVRVGILGSFVNAIITAVLGIGERFEAKITSSGSVETFSSDAVDWKASDFINDHVNLLRGQLIETNTGYAVFLDADSLGVDILRATDGLSRVPYHELRYHTMEPNRLNIASRLMNLIPGDNVRTTDGKFLFDGFERHYVHIWSAGGSNECPWADVFWDDLPLSTDSIVSAMTARIRAETGRALLIPPPYVSEEKHGEPCVNERRGYLRPPAPRPQIDFDHSVTNINVAVRMGDAIEKWSPKAVGLTTLANAKMTPGVHDINFFLEDGCCSYVSENRIVAIRLPQEAHVVCGDDSDDAIDLGRYGKRVLGTGWEKCESGVFMLPEEGLNRVHEFYIKWFREGVWLYARVRLDISIKLTISPGSNFRQMGMCELMSDEVGDVWAKWSQRRIGRKGFYVCAPSGSGKTTFAKNYADVNGLAVRDFDDYAVFPRSVVTHPWWRVPSIDNEAKRRNSEIMSTVLEGTSDIWLSYPLDVAPDILVLLPEERHLKNLESRDTEQPSHKHPRASDLERVRSTPVNSVWVVDSFDEAMRLILGYQFVMERSH